MGRTRLAPLLQTGEFEMRLVRNLALAAAAALAVTFVAGADQAARAQSYDGNFMVRLQGTAVITQDKLKSLNSTGLGDLKAAGFDADVSDRILPTATLTYFFNRNLAVELFCCFSKHAVELKPPAAFAALRGDVAESWIFPPILTLQYHMTGMGPFKPYVGAGVQWIHFFNSKTADNTLAATGVKFDDAFGPAIQAGIDVEIGSGWYLNVDVKKSWLDTKVTWVNTVAGNVVAKDRLDPLTISLGLGYRFDLGRGPIEPLK